MADSEFLDLDDVSTSPKHVQKEEVDTAAEEYDLDDFNQDDHNDFYENHFTQVSRKILNDPSQSVIDSLFSDNHVNALPTDNFSSQENKFTKPSNESGNSHGSKTERENTDSLINSTYLDDISGAYGIPNTHNFDVGQFFQDLDDFKSNSDLEKKSRSDVTPRVQSGGQTGKVNTADVTNKEETSTEQSEGQGQSGKVNMAAVNENLSKENNSGIVEQMSVAKSQFLEAKQSLQKLLLPETSGIAEQNKIQNSEPKQTAQNIPRKSVISMNNLERTSDENREKRSVFPNDKKGSEKTTVKRVRFEQQVGISDAEEDGEMEDGMIECFEIEDSFPTDNDSEDENEESQERSVPDGRPETMTVLENEILSDGNTVHRDIEPMENSRKRNMDSNEIVVTENVKPVNTIGKRDGLRVAMVTKQDVLRTNPISMDQNFGGNRTGKENPGNDRKLGNDGNPGKDPEKDGNHGNSSKHGSDENLWHIVESSKSSGSLTRKGKIPGERSKSLPGDEDSREMLEQKVLESAVKGDLESLKSTLLRESSLSKVCDDRGNTLLHIVCKYDHMDCLEWMVNHGCKDMVLSLNDDAETPAVVTVKYGQLECLQWLVLESIGKTQLTTMGESPALVHHAARYGQEPCLRWLLGYMQTQDLSIDITDCHGNTAAHLAAKYGHLSCLQTLVEFNADVTAINKKGHTPCKVAANHHHDTSAQFLIVVESCILLAEQVTNYRKDLREVKQENLVLRSRLDDLQDEYVDLTGKLVKQLDDLYQKKTTHRTRSTSSLDKLGTTEKLGVEIAASKEKAEALKRRCEELTEHERQMKEKEERDKMRTEEKIQRQKQDFSRCENSKTKILLDDNFSLEPLSVMRSRLREVSHRLMVYHNAKTVHDREVLAASRDSLSSRSSLSSPMSLSPGPSPRTSVSSANSPPGYLPRYASYNSLLKPQSSLPDHRRHSDGHKAETYFTEPVTLTTAQNDRKQDYSRNNTGIHSPFGNRTDFDSGKPNISMDSQSTANTQRDLDIDIPCIEVQASSQERTRNQEYSMENSNLPKESNLEHQSHFPSTSSIDNDSVFEEYSIEGMFSGSPEEKYNNSTTNQEMPEQWFNSQVNGVSANQNALFEQVTAGNQSQAGNSRKSSSPNPRSCSSTSSTESFESESKKPGYRGSTGSAHSEGLYDSVGSDGKPIPESIPQWILTSNKPRRPEPIIEKIGSSTENLKRIFAKHIPAHQLDVIRRMDECMRKVQPTKSKESTDNVTVRMGKSMVELPQNLAAEMNARFAAMEDDKDKSGKVKLKRRNNKDRRIKYSGFKGGARNGSDEDAIKEMLAPIYEHSQNHSVESQRLARTDGDVSHQLKTSPKNANETKPKEKKSDLSGAVKTDHSPRNKDASSIAASQEVQKHGNVARNANGLKETPHKRENDKHVNTRQDNFVSDGNSAKARNEERHRGNETSLRGNAPLRENETTLRGNETTMRGNGTLRGNETTLRGNETTLHGNETMLRGNGTLRGNESILRGNETTLDDSRLSIGSVSTIPNGGHRIPMSLTDLPSNEFDDFSFSQMSNNEEDSGKAWYESSDEEDNMEPVPRPKNTSKKSTNSAKSSSTPKDKGNKHIYFL
ncbi:uncharacterized protein LOC144450110 [Glandiceps talaboti]